MASIRKGKGKYKVSRHPHVLVDPAARGPWRSDLARVVQEAASLRRNGDPKSALLRVSQIEASVIDGSGSRTEGLPHLAVAHCFSELGDYDSAVEYTIHAIDSLISTTDSVGMLVAASRLGALVAQGHATPPGETWGDPMKLEALLEGAAADALKRRIVTEDEVSTLTASA